MYQCVNCGGNLRFDIPTQMLVCDYCKSSYDCHEFDEKEEKDLASYEANVIMCPQCGGQMISNDLNVADFCSYCGSSVIFESRLAQNTRPAKIVPFKKTKEDCRQLYGKLVKKSFFAPKELKKPEFIEKFRGIYIPYWMYGFHYKGKVKLTGTKSYRKGDYDITDYYTIKGDIDSNIEGITYDASSSFDDTISAAIAPYKPEEMEDFSPAYLSGFYADIADVGSEIYQTDANEVANNEAIRIICKDPEVASYEISKSSNVKTMNDKLCATVDEPVAAMLPVWFLTWRDRDRVAYTTVNGQTGKVYADIPIDIRKYILVSLVLAVPIYFILNFLISFTAPVSLLLAGFFAFGAGCLYFMQLQSIVDRDRHVDDRGYNDKMKREKKKAVREQVLRERAEGAAISQEEREVILKTGKKPKKKTDKASTKKKSAATNLLGKLSFGGFFLYLGFLAIRFFIYESILTAIFSVSSFAFLLLDLLLFLWYFLSDYCDEQKIDHPAGREILFSQLTGMAAGVIDLIRPVNDLIYYVGMIAVYVGIILTLVMIMRRYNNLITRPIPDFHQRGGMEQ